MGLASQLHDLLRDEDSVDLDETLSLSKSMHRIRLTLRALESHERTALDQALSRLAHVLAIRMAEAVESEDRAAVEALSKVGLHVKWCAEPRRRGRL